MPPNRSQPDLFDTAPAHDPGGRVRTALPPDVRGDAEFSPCGRYRPMLRRWTGDAFPERYALFVGMNPSTASAEANDPTVAREWQFTVREGFNGYAKANVGDYRATFPKDLKDVEVSSPLNLPAIRRAAAGAGLVVLCHGVLNRYLREAGELVVETLRADGIEMWCFGTTSDGSPRHPLYLAKDTPLVRYRP